MDMDIGARPVSFSCSSSSLRGGSPLTITLEDDIGLGDPQTQLQLKFVGSSHEKSCTATVVAPRIACVDIPAWDKAEEVTVHVLMMKDAWTVDGHVQRSESMVAFLPFSYCSDPAHDAVQHLLASVDKADALEFSEPYLRQYGLPHDDSSKLDLVLTRAFAQVCLPDNWSVLGRWQKRGADNPRETLLHFAARLGLRSVVQHIVTRMPGGRDAVYIPNKMGLLPGDVAREASHDDIAKYLNSFLEWQQDAFSLTDLTMPQVESGNYKSKLNSSDGMMSVHLDQDVLQEVHAICAQLQNESLLNTGANCGLVLPIPEGRAQHIPFETTEQVCIDNSDSATRSKSLRMPQAERPLYDSIGEIQAVIKDVQDRRSRVQFLRKENLSRYSTSCPSLDGSWADKAQLGRYRSMLSATKEEDEELVALTDSPKLRGESLRGRERPRSLDCSLSAAAVSLGSASRSRNSDEAVLLLSGVTEGSSTVSSENVHNSGYENGSSPATPEHLRQVSRTMFGGAQQQKSRFHHGIHTAESRSFSLGSLGSEDESEGFTEETSDNPNVGNKLDDIPHSDTHLQRRDASAPSLSKRPQSYGGPETSLPLAKNSEPLSLSIPGLRLRASSALVTPYTNLNKSKSVSTPSIRGYLAPDHPRFLPEALVSNPEAHGEEEDDSPTSLHDDDSRKKLTAPRRFSMAFSKLGSQRKGKESKEGKKIAHNFTSIPQSTAPCDICGRSLSGSKLIVQCSNCLGSLHDECRSKATLCTRAKANRKTSSLAQPLLRHVRSAHSFRVTSVPQLLSPSSLSSGSLQQLAEVSRALSTQANVLAMTAMTKSTSQEFKDSTYFMQEVSSASIESLVECGNEDFEEDPELLGTPEPESWSDLVDKKILKKLNAKYIQRQDNIFEFIGTERLYFRTLRMIQKVFVCGMIKQCNFSEKDVEKIFPGLGNLVEVHYLFLTRLQARQDEKADKSVDAVGDIILEQFSNAMGERMKDVYGRFVSRQREAVEYYKDRLKTDRCFQEFIKRCSANPNTRRRGVQDLITIVTQRMTKYKTLLEQIIKNTKDAKDRLDKENLAKALECNKSILEHIDEAIETRSKELRLIEIYTRVDVRAVASYDKTKTFKKSDFLAKGRRLRHEGIVAWRNAREKEVETLVVLLSDVVVFLQDNPQKYIFFSQDNKASVIPLSKLLVREKGSTKDNRGIYLIRQSRDDPEMIELVCRTAAERRDWIEAFRKATHECPEEDEGTASENAEESREVLEKLAKVNELIEGLKAKDDDLEALCKHRFQLLSELFTEYGHMDICDQIRSGYNEDGEFMQAVDLIKFALGEVSRLSSTYMVLPPVSPPGSAIWRSWSSAGEHQTPGNHPPLMPKRSDTFGGFEQGAKIMGTVGSPGKHKSASDQASLQGSSIGSQEWSFHDSDSGIKEVHSFDARDSGGGLKKVLPVAGQQVGERSSASLMQLLAAGNSTGSSQQIESAGITSAANSGEYLVALSNIASVTAIIPPSREQLLCLGQLSEYLQALLLITNKQDTTIESYKQQLADALLRTNKLSLEVDKMSSEKRNAFRHNRQMEEIRNLHEQVSKERQQMETDKENWRRLQDAEQQRLYDLRLEYERQQEEIRLEREELQRQREALQRQIDFHSTTQAKLPSATAGRGSPMSPMAGSVINSTSLGLVGVSNLRIPSLAVAGSHPAINAAQIVHQRSHSADLPGQTAVPVYGDASGGSAEEAYALSTAGDGKEKVASSGRHSVQTGSARARSATSGHHPITAATVPQSKKLSTNSSNSQSFASAQVVQMLPLKLASGSQSLPETSHSSSASADTARSTVTKKAPTHDTGNTGAELPSHAGVAVAAPNPDGQDIIYF